MAIVHEALGPAQKGHLGLNLVSSLLGKHQNSQIPGKSAKGRKLPTNT
jgi:hypothetical protein